MQKRETLNAINLRLSSPVKGNAYLLTFTLDLLGNQILLSNG